MSGVMWPFVSSAPPIAAGLPHVTTLHVTVPNKALFHSFHSINCTLHVTGILPVKMLEILIVLFLNTSALVYYSNSMPFQSYFVSVWSLSSEVLPTTRANNWTVERTMFPRFEWPLRFSNLLLFLWNYLCWRIMIIGGISIDIAAIDEFFRQCHFHMFFDESLELICVSDSIFSSSFINH